MILIFLFIAAFLTGIALFATGVSSSFLNKPVRRKSVTYRPTPQERGYRKEVRTASPERDVYPERIEEKIEERAASVPPQYYVKAQEKEIRPRKRRTGGFKPLWVFIFIGMIGIMFFSAYFGYEGYKALAAKPKIIFCEYVDFGRLKPVNVSDTFTRGNVSVFVKSRTPFHLDKAQIDIYKVEGYTSERYVNKKIPMKPQWTAFAVRVLFEKIGSYNVRISDMDGRPIIQKSIHIVPDYFVYRAVSPSEYY